MQLVSVWEVPEPEVLLLRRPCTASHLFLYFFNAIFIFICMLCHSSGNSGSVDQ